MKGDDISGRLVDLAVASLRVAVRLEDSPTGKHIARQMIRSATGGGSNYEEARSAESRADFAHKLGVAAKEVRETSYWLTVIERAGLSPESDLRHLREEARQLVAILTASARTAKRASRPARAQARPNSGFPVSISVPVSHSGAVDP